MNYFLLYFGLAAVAYVVTKLLPSVFGKTHEIFETIFYEPRIGIPAILVWPAIIVIGFILQRLKLHPTNPAAEDIRKSRVRRRRNSKDDVASLPQPTPVTILGQAKCVSNLRPTGKVEFNGKIVQATSLDQHIDQGEVVLVIEKRENQLVVIRNDPDGNQLSQDTK